MTSMASQPISKSLFLPLLDDLLSPEYRQQLTTPATTNSIEAAIKASVKIQRWWRRLRSQQHHQQSTEYKHKLSHSRSDEYILYLEQELKRLKTELELERKSRLLQLEAIRGLYVQVTMQQQQQQKGDSVAMATTTTPPPPKKDSCTSCTEKIQELRSELTSELSSLKKLIEDSSKQHQQQRPSNLNLPGSLGNYADGVANKICRNVE